MQFKRFDKRFLPMLWIGLAIWAVGIGGMLLLDALGVAVDSQATLMGISKFFFHLTPVGTVLLLCLIQPVLEEVAFRLWGVGRRGTTITCLVFMALFTFGGYAFWGIFVIIGVAMVMRTVADDFKRKWYLTLLTSALFTLGHVSGFSGFSLGMVLGLMDIFGMALVMCWLTLNLSFWFSCLLHVCNNSLAILIPLIFVGSPYHGEHTQSDLHCHTTLESLHPFADNQDLIYGSDQNFKLTEPGSEYRFVGEPQELAARLLLHDTTFDHSNYEFLPIARNQNLEERIIWSVKLDSARYPDYGKYLTMFLHDYSAYAEEPLIFDTSDVVLDEMWVVYESGEEIKVDNDTLEECKIVLSRLENDIFGMSNRKLVSESVFSDSGQVTTSYYSYAYDNPLAEAMALFDDAIGQAYGFKIEYRPSGRKIKLITIK